MRAAFENIPVQKGTQAFLAYHMVMPSFEFIWHYHPEYELTLIVKGTGKRLVGDSYEQYKAGDLALIGPDLPHTWVSEKTKIKGEMQEAIVVQFPQALFASLIQFAEFAEIKNLLLQSVRGLAFKSTITVRKLIASLPMKTGAEKISILLQVLESLNAMKTTVLSSATYITPQGSQSEKRINKVCTYIQNNFTRHFKLSDVAHSVHLSPSALCKFVKKSLNKTFSDYVNDVRVSHACKLLTETDHSIQRIATASGFETITYFNRVFLKKKGMKPSQFRKIK